MLRHQRANHLWQPRYCAVVTQCFRHDPRKLVVLPVKPYLVGRTEVEERIHFENLAGLLGKAGRSARQQLEAGTRDAGLFFNFALLRFERLFTLLDESGDA